MRSAEGARCGFGAALVRNLLRLVDAIALYLVGLIAALVTRKKQRLGDDLATHTIVLREPSGAFKPEERIQLFYDVPGYKPDSGSTVDVVTQNRVLAPDGKPFFEDQTITVRQKTEDETQPLKMHYFVILPDWAPPGKYTINIEGEDRVAHKTAAASTSFMLVGAPVETSATFVAKSIEIANSRDGPALNPPVLTAGQSVWLRFRMLGMKAKESGQVRLTEDWSLIGPDGKAVFEKNEDSMVDERFIYPPPFIPYRESVSIPPSADAGDYRFHVVLHDRIGGADFSLDQPFKIQKPSVADLL